MDLASFEGKVDAMLFKYNIEKLERVLQDFHEVTGITVGVFDTQFNCLSHYPKIKSCFCEMIQSIPEGCRRCVESDCRLLARCLEEKRPVSHRCHAGLSDTVVPIMNGEVLIGFIMFGQIREDSVQKISFKEIFENVKDLGLDREALRRAYGQLVFLDSQKVESAAEIVTMLTKYIYVERLIEQEYSSKEMERIAEYIDSHLTDKLSVSSLCRSFNLSKNALYNLFNVHMECPVKEYINARRLERAEQLLKTTELPIYEVCEQCGIENYQYFCRLFKKEKGETPLQYRKKRKSPRYSGLK